MMSNRGRRSRYKDRAVSIVLHCVTDVEDGCPSSVRHGIECLTMTQWREGWICIPSITCREDQLAAVVDVVMCNQAFGCSSWCLARAVVLQPSEAHNVVEEEELSFTLNHHHTLLPHGSDGVENWVDIIRDGVKVTAFQMSE
jgi:hypothetical protein